MTDPFTVLSWPEVFGVVILGIGLGYVLHRTHHYNLQGLVVGLASGSLFFGLLITSRLLLFPEAPQLAALRTFTWGLYVLFITTVAITVTAFRGSR